jgi:predicted amidohydrolase
MLNPKAKRRLDKNITRRDFFEAGSLGLGLAAVASAEPMGADEKRPNLARHSLVRVVTVSQDAMQAPPGKAMLEATLGRLNEAAVFRPDIACLPELFTRGEPEPVPGPTTDRLGQWAKEHGSHLVCPIRTRSGEAVFNSAVLIGRRGEILGQYHKIRPTENELKERTCPGPLDPPVLETDFGKIGIQICFDVNWHAQWAALKQKDARIIFFPSAFPAARQLAHHAWMNQCYIVSATMTRAASIYDVTGDRLASSGKYRPWAGAVLPLDKRVFEIDFHTGKMRQIEKKYGAKVEVAWYHDDDLVTLASLDPNLPLEAIIKEYELTPHTGYIQRAQQAQDGARKQLQR